MEHQSLALRLLRIGRSCRCPSWALLILAESLQSTWYLRGTGSANMGCETRDKTCGKPSPEELSCWEKKQNITKQKHLQSIKKIRLDLFIGTKVAI